MSNFEWIFSKNRLPVEADGVGYNSTVLVFVNEGDREDRTSTKGYYYLLDLDEYLYEGARENYLQESWQPFWTKWARVPEGEK